MPEAAEKSIDIVLFGASGVTGKYVIEELAQHTNDIKWCVAGRSKEKLKKALEEVGNFIGKDLKDVEIIEADVNNQDSLINMCQKAKLVINCVGPYRFFGEQVVSAAVESGTHHVDVSGEPQYLESMQVKYFNAAKDKKIYVVGACGFDSIPCDMGIEFLKSKFTGDLASVETFMKIEADPGAAVGANFATWQSAIHGFANARELGPLRRKLRENLYTKDQPRSSFKLRKRPVLFKSREVGSWCIPFMGSDKSVVSRTQMHNYQFKNQRPVQINTYTRVSSLLAAVGTLFFGLIFSLLARCSCGRGLLEKFPELFSCGMFSKNPPLRENADKGSYSITFIGKGWPEKLAEPGDQHTDRTNQKIKAVVTAHDLAYISTAVCVVSSALVVLQEADKLPDVGGVLTPGAAFQNTSLIDKLQTRGITFSIVD